MSNNNMKAYLASKYMSGPKADMILEHAGVKKKRKRTKNEDYTATVAEAGGLVLQDADEWKKSKRRDVDLDEEDAPVVGKGAATFKKGASAWSTVGATALPVPARVKEEPRDDEAGPSTAPSETAAPKPQLTKRRGGLRTAAELTEEAAAASAERSPSPEPDAQATTVHRDQAGRVLDVEQLRAEARREELEEQLKEKEREEWTKGFKQREERERRAKEEAAMASQDVARRADDTAMNAELREVERWNDPAAQFLTTSKKRKKGPKRPVYKGSWAQNRFGIAPGYRWDGVDRSTGFEKKWLLAQNARERQKYESDRYDMEDL
ncbi:hypothetical protein CC85DRAFT_284339 [Cutaneotrichosporon oleaginosum]|uniref:Pre-mRNA-splicing factor CWC26 n=1 Tax=Cutaneotrichosporon oleaginosum TaxID=879819 RepID=A0A0J0XR73_9TREE|nr:uncharacterized protein CC85DRAFT_284339 [Cutaneotrichosporon oleaginosum]KLT43631.1 hypothetical protein CC85DRAFT_284339 [Cutaneotrichosporon oleaginosum]TXT12702.1 hypothetical protein COLE_03112 [Cutaneotrichosporon oleaginosum]